MTATTDLTAWLNEHYSYGWFLTDDGSLLADEPTPAGVPVDPLRYDGDAPVYHPLRQRLIDHGKRAAICRRCGQPSSHITRHAAEVHGDDVEVLAPRPGYAPPDWFRDGWI